MSLLETLAEYAVKIMAWAGGMLLIAALIAFLTLSAVTSVTSTIVNSSLTPCFSS